MDIFNTLDFPSLILLVGSSNSGKSYLIQYLLKMGCLNNKFNFGMIFTATKYNQDFNFLPDKFVISGYNEKVLKQYLAKLEAYAKSHPVTFQQKKQGIYSNVPHNFVVFDDLIGLIPLSRIFCELLWNIQTFEYNFHHHTAIHQQSGTIS